MGRRQFSSETSRTKPIVSGLSSSLSGALRISASFSCEIRLTPGLSSKSPGEISGLYPVAKIMAPKLRDSSSPPFFILREKSPTSPSPLVSSAEVRTSMSLFSSIAFLMELIGSAGLVSNPASLPPKATPLSSKVVLSPRLARSRATFIPANPPPTTKTSLFTGTSFFTKGFRNRALSTAMAVSSRAFSVTSPS